MENHTLTCTRCQENLHKSEFSKCKTFKRGYSYRCRKCDSETAAERRIKRKKEDPDYHRRQNLKHKYGITLEEFYEKLDNQNWECPICSITLTIRGDSSHKVSTAVVDHCHITKSIRGVLCTMCNKGIGILGDNSERVKRALNYLEEAEGNIENVH